MFQFKCNIFLLLFFFTSITAQENLSVKYWDETKKVKKEEGWLINNKREGKWTEYYNNGNKKQEVFFKNGVADSSWVEWYENGNKKSTGTIVNGKQEGIEITWYENGNKKKEEYFKNGKTEIEGTNTYWYENGNKWYIISFSEGKKTDVFEEWFENGQQRIKAAKSKDGKVVFTEWDSSGKVINSAKKQE